MSTFKHGRQRGADRAHHREHVEVERGVEDSHGRFQHGSAGNSARAIEQDIASADIGEETPDCVLVADVQLSSRDAGRFAAQCGKCRLVDVGRRPDVSTFFRIGESGRAADARSRRSHDSRFSCKTHGASP